MRMSSHFVDVSSSYSTLAIVLFASAARARLFLGGGGSFLFLFFSFYTLQPGLFSGQSLPVHGLG